MGQDIVREASGSTAEFEDVLGALEVRMCDEVPRRRILVEVLGVLLGSEPILEGSSLLPAQHTGYARSPRLARVPMRFRAFAFRHRIAQVAS